MPHFDSPEMIQHVTFHLADSLPGAAVERMKAEVESLPPDKRARELRIRLEAWIDAGHGSCSLEVPELGDLLQESLLRFDGERYRLHAWVVMPNHVHVLFQPCNGWTMSKIVASWKSFTGRRISEWRKIHSPVSHVPNPEERVWQREYWDRYIRDQNHFLDALAYIHRNPVKAGLVDSPSEWRWTSAVF